MEKNDLTIKYEMVFIIDSKLTPDEKEAAHKEVTDIISKSGGKVINGQIWLDKHRFTFPIQKRSEGTYYIVNFEAGSSTNEKIKSLLKLNERVLRYLIAKAEAPVAAKV